MRADASGEEPDLQSADLDSFELVRPRSVEVEHLRLWAMDQLALRTRLQTLGLPGSLCAAAIEDQFRICREHAEREGWKIAGAYRDAAVSTTA